MRSHDLVSNLSARRRCALPNPPGLNQSRESFSFCSSQLTLHILWDVLLGAPPCFLTRSRRCNGCGSKLSSGWTVKDDRRVRGPVVVRAGRGVHVERDVVCGRAVALVDVSGDGYRHGAALDCPPQILAPDACRTAAAGMVTAAVRRAVRHENVDALRDHSPLLPALLATSQVERPIAKGRLPRRAVDAIATDLHGFILEVCAIPGREQLSCSSAIQRRLVEPPPPALLVKLGVERDVMIACDYDLMLSGVRTQPANKALNLIQFAGICEVAGVKQHVGLNHMRCRNLVVQAVGVAEAHEARPPIRLHLSRIADDARTARYRRC
mmetsp:Transcript_3887/g.13104  ORF Transcript_3887/g.13104 Transcript_3887/m.13104 type:complete len:324 (+) Transcript_3887:58-1029(+)